MAHTSMGRFRLLLLTSGKCRIARKLGFFIDGSRQCVVGLLELGLLFARVELAVCLSLPSIPRLNNPCDMDVLLLPVQEGEGLEEA